RSIIDHACTVPCVHHRSYRSTTTIPCNRNLIEGLYVRT
uniref:Uncharacterized protein n=1 Tax=Aegilops tauschii subsp. strangulata TaxID=200361 RepID=A0A453GWX7_AEGTS